MLDTLDFESEILFVDDASEDDGERLLRRFAEADLRIRLLSLSRHAGQSAALEAGFRAASGDWVATLDADGQNDPADLPRLLSGLASGADCVNGFRAKRQDRWAKRWASRLANGIRRRMLGDPVRDIGCSLRVMRADILGQIKMFRGSHRFLPALLAMEGASIIEMPVNHRPRVHGASNYAVLDRLRETWIDLLAAIWMKHRVLRYEVKELARRPETAERTKISRSV